MSYIGNPIVSTDFPKDTFSGNGSTTAFTMQIAPASVNSVIVVVSGITQDPSTYTISGTTLTFSAAPPTGTNNISVRHLGIAGIPNTPSAGSVVATSIADGTITAAKFASGQTPSFNGIAFPATQSASANANTLDDYEEGTWTPVVTSSAGSITSYTINSAKYTKIGDTVNISVEIYLPNTGTASGALIFTIPFTTAFSSGIYGREYNVAGYGMQGRIGAYATSAPVFHTKADNGNAFVGSSGMAVTLTSTIFV